MKYQCDNCQYCCISTSPEINYCGLNSECSQEPISKALLIGVPVLSTILFAAFLFGLYYFLRNRQFANHLQPNLKIQSDVIKPQKQGKTKIQRSSHKQEDKAIRKKDKSKDKSKDKARRNTKSKSKKTNNKSLEPQTQRGLV